MSNDSATAVRIQSVTTGMLSVLAMILLGACSGGETAPDATDLGTISTDQRIEDTLELPMREGPRRQTTGSVPHIQLDTESVPAVDSELRRRAFQLPGVQNLASDRSLPGARGIAFPDGFDLDRPDVIAGSSEFAHIHPDGSLHVWLGIDSATEVDNKKWGELHPWVGRDGFWDGVVLVYTPETLDELDVTIQILVDAYNFVTGSSLHPADIP